MGDSVLAADQHVGPRRGPTQREAMLILREDPRIRRWSLWFLRNLGFPTPGYRRFLRPPVIAGEPGEGRSLAYRNITGAGGEGRVQYWRAGTVAAEAVQRTTMLLASP